MKMKRKSRTTSEKRTRRRNLLRTCISVLILLLFAVPMFGGGVQPLPVIPAVICIAMYEEFYFSVFCGVLGGLLIDTACFSPLGSNAIYLVCVAAAVWLLFKGLLRRSFLHYICVTAAAVFLRCGLLYFFTQVLMQNEGRAVLWTNVLLPSSLWTLVTALPVYWLFLPCERFLRGIPAGNDFRLTGRTAE
ncbi:MAG: rod shape-determining protein MreD [Oscillospiraceae bacterium]|nr:rod shape-determining protein MreD [Oscillospiraceae bacterium]